MRSSKKEYSEVASIHRPELLQAIFKVVIPQEISDIVRTEILSDKISGKIYLVGSKAIELVAKHTGVELSRTRTQDFDFLFLSDSMSTVADTTFPTFRLNKKLSNHTMLAYYRDTRSIPGTTPCDLIVKQTSLEKHAKSLDIRLSSFAILLNGKPDDVGSVFDPLGQALQDLKAKRITIIGDPDVCFRENPVALLRTIKYLARIKDVTADPALSRALCNFTPENCLSDDHFLVVLKQLLESTEYRKIISQMLKYNLVNKLALHRNIGPKDHGTEITIKMREAFDVRPCIQEINQHKLTTGPLLVDQDISREAAYEEHIYQKHIDKLQTKNVALSAQLNHTQAIIQLNNQRIAALKSQLMEDTKTLGVLDTVQEKLMQYKEQEAQLVTLDTRHDVLFGDHPNDSEHAEIQELKKEYRLLQEQQKHEMIKIRNQRVILERQKKEKAAELAHIQANYEVTITHHEARLKAAHAEIEQLQKTRKQTQSVQHRKHTPKTSPAVASEEVALAETISLIDAAIEQDLSMYSLTQLEAIFLKTSTCPFYCAIAYKLGVDAEDKQADLRAAYFYLRVLARQPTHQKAKERLLAVQSNRQAIDWSDTTPQYWYKKASETSQTGSSDELLLYYTLAITCDPHYINGYIKRLHYFYQKDEVLHFVEDYNTLCTLVLAEKNKIIDRRAALLPSENAVRESLIKKLLELDHTSSFMCNLLKKLTKRTTPPDFPDPHVSQDERVHQCLRMSTMSLEEKIKQLWNATYLYSLLCIDKTDYITTCKNWYEKIIYLDKKKSIDYAYAHYGLYTCYLRLGKQALAFDHGMEASCVLSAIALMEKSFSPQVESYLKEKHRKITLKNSDGYKAQNCYFLALCCLDLMIDKYPHMTEAYWSKFKTCILIDQHELIPEKQMDHLISMYRREMDSDGLLTTCCRVIELHLMKGDFSLARTVYRQIPSRKLASRPQDLYSEILGKQLSDEVITNTRERCKVDLNFRALNAHTMASPDIRFEIYRLFSKIYRDEANDVAARNCLHMALCNEVSADCEYSYEQAEQELNQLLYTTQKEDYKGTGHDELIYAHQNPGSFLLSFFRHPRTSVQDAATNAAPAAGEDSSAAILSPTLTQAL